MGAWIETPWKSVAYDPHLSHPSWVRGLKLVDQTDAYNQVRRTLHGCVD